VRLFHPCALKLFPSVPARRLFQMDFDCLLCFGNVVPAAVGLPAVRNYLNQYSSGRSFRNVRGAVAIGLHVQPQPSYFSQLVLFDVFQYTLAFSTGVLFSPPDTSIVTRDIKSDLPVRALGSDSCAACAHRPPQSAMVANATQTPILICGFILERNLRRCNLSSTDCSCRSSLLPLSLMPTSGCALLRRGSPPRVENAFCRKGQFPHLRQSGQCSTIGKLSQNLFVAWIDWRAMLLYLF